LGERERSGNPLMSVPYKAKDGRARSPERVCAHACTHTHTRAHLLSRSAALCAALLSAWLRRATALARHSQRAQTRPTRQALRERASALFIRIRSLGATVRSRSHPSVRRWDGSGGCAGGRGKASASQQYSSLQRNAMLAHSACDASRCNVQHSYL
jgi:hypothetical protein